MTTLILAAALSGFTLVAQTPRADYYTLDRRLKVDVKTCEAFLEKTERMLGVHVPHFEYYRVGSPSDVFRLGSMKSYGGGEAQPRPLYAMSIVPCDKHELTHLLTFQIGRSDAVFEEGLAGYLSKEHGMNDRWDCKRAAKRLRLSYRDIEKAFREYRSGRMSGNASQLHVHYVVSEEFIRHLTKRYGLPRVIGYLRDADADRAFGSMPQDAFDSWLYGKKAPLR